MEFGLFDINYEYEVFWCEVLSYVNQDSVINLP